MCFQDSVLTDKKKLFSLQFLEVATKKHVTVRKVTRGSPDSDDSFCDESPDGYLGRRDDQFLVSDRNENKFYGKNFTLICTHFLYFEIKFN